jgi:hypothetical protein
VLHCPPRALHSPSVPFLSSLWPLPSALGVTDSDSQQEQEPPSPQSSLDAELLDNDLRVLLADLDPDIVSRSWSSPFVCTRVCTPVEG